MCETKVYVPSVMWAQRRDGIYITFNVVDCKNPEIDVQENCITFKGKSEGNKLYKLSFNVYEEIDPSTSKKCLTDRFVRLYIKRKTAGDYWPRLLKESAKVFWLKTDFALWKDEEDSDTEEKGDDFSNFNNMMGGAGGMPNMPDLEGADSDDEENSDDEPIPELEKVEKKENDVVA
ncbi:Co-chaperone protein SBA1 [Intoshia linei]|uniref:Co-chaperone protein SBA1 n=1 Tax=Intoshia linei TaxID=1819745 RepID=A0A177B2M8_9BILA|nr:Co-chaperone protein SBA1 [Intoshia linei]